MVAAEQLLADDFVLSSTGGVGEQVTRGAWLETLGEIDTRSLRCDVREVRVFGDTAVVHARLRWDATLGERDLTGEYAVADVFTTRGESWRASWRISVRL